MSHLTKKHELLGVMYEDIPGEGGVKDNRMKPAEIATKMKISLLKALILIKFLKARGEIRPSFIGAENLDEVRHDTLYEITPGGMIAHQFGYYKNQWLNSLKDNAKDLIAIVTPLLSLIVALVAIIYSKNTDLENKIDNIDKKIHKIEVTISTSSKAKITDKSKLKKVEVEKAEVKKIEEKK
jgi:hypothetical protein